MTPTRPVDERALARLLLDAARMLGRLTSLYERYVAALDHLDDAEGDDPSPLLDELDDAMSEAHAVVAALPAEILGVTR